LGIRQMSLVVANRKRTSQKVAAGRRGLTVALLSIGCSGAVIFGAISSSFTPEGFPLALGAIAVLLLVTANRVLGTFLLSPVQIVVGGLLLLAVLGRLFHGAIADVRGGAAITIHLAEDATRQTQNLILLAAVLMLSGALLVLAICGGKAKIPHATFQGFKLNDSSYKLIALGAPLPLFLLVIGYGPSKLLERSYYIEQHVGSPGIVSAGTLLSLGAVAGLGCLWAARKYRAWVLVLVALAALIFLGLGSRRLALIPVIFTLGMLAINTSRRTRLTVMASCAFSFYLIGLPLKFRAQASHGILPYLSALPDIVAVAHPWAATAQNLLISFAIIGKTAMLQPFPLRDLYISLSPIPGSLVGWYDIAPNHRLNVYTPAAALGELRNAGLVATVIVCPVLGAILAWLEIRAKRLLADGRQILSLVLIVLSTLFLPFFMQYNLRTAARMLYYALAVDVVAGVFNHRRHLRHATALMDEEDISGAKGVRLSSRKWVNDP
jgi:hypothetical protein